MTRTGEHTVATPLHWFLPAVVFWLLGGYLGPIVDLVASH